MKTISAKELRLNLEKVVAQARAGEHFRVTYRNKPAFTIGPEPTSQAGRKRMSGLDGLLASARKGYTPDPDKSFKELYREHLGQKYGKDA